MRKLSIVFMAVLIAAIAGCAGDDSSGDTGTLTTVQDLQLDDTSTGRTVVLTWSEIADDIDGYKIYFKADGTGTWADAGESNTTSYTHNAVVAGHYAVKAYKGDNYSENFSNEVSTMPMVFSGTYTIYDQFAAADKHSGFIFKTNSGDYGVTGLAGQENFSQDMSAYDDSNKGDFNVSLYSGSEQYTNGNPSFFQVPASGVYGNCDPSGNWYISKEIYTGDSVLFVKLPYDVGPAAYAKIYNLTIGEEPTANGTSVSFSFEYQPNTLGLTLFTSTAN